jgi:hypothetical protein
MRSQPEITIDSAIQFLAEYASGPRGRERYSSYGYEIYLPNVVWAFLTRVHGQPPSTTDAVHSDQGRRVFPTFYDAAWELCRRGVLRPGLQTSGLQSTDDGASGNGYSITEIGRRWLKEFPQAIYIPTEPVRFAKLLESFRPQLGEAFFQRSQEAAKCYFATAYLACCAMCGAAAEAVLLNVALAKTNDEQKIKKEYFRASGRTHIENLVVGQAEAKLSQTFRELTKLINYWRDETAHGTLSDITEFEAYEAMARLLRYAHFVVDNWERLT